MMSSPGDHGFDVLEQVIGRSRVVAALTSAAAMIRGSARRSSAAAMLQGLLAELRALELAQQLRLVGVFVATFAGGHALLLSLVPVRSAPAIPAATWLLVVLAGGTLAAGADAFALAWRHRSGGLGLPRRSSPPMPRAKAGRSGKQ